MVLKLFAKDKIYSPGQRVEEYTVQNVIGEGKYGICYIVNNGNEKYVFKQLKSRLLRKMGFKAGYEEELLINLQHHCIPKFIKKVKTEELTGYILEFKEGKTFEEIVFKDRFVFEKKEIYNIAKQLIDIIKYLHNMGVVHRDIRLPNVIYSEKEICLVDFGLARWSSDKYKCDLDFSYLGDFLLHLYYTSYEAKGSKSAPWYEELDLQEMELLFLKRLMGIDNRYKDILEVEKNFLQLMIA